MSSRTYVTCVRKELPNVVTEGSAASSHFFKLRNRAIT